MRGEFWLPNGFLNQTILTVHAVFRVPEVASTALEVLRGRSDEYGNWVAAVAHPSGSKRMPGPAMSATGSLTLRLRARHKCLQ